MTTIAYKDGVLAADSMVCTKNGIKIAQINKIIKNKNGMAGIAGNLGDVSKIKEWMNIGADINKLLDFSKGSSAIFIKPDGSINFIEEGSVINVAADFVAVGTGEEIAMASMMAGVSAKKAVHIACKLDAYSGGKIKTVRMKY
ncbi:MAG: hypothetical protein GY941_16540 [Planctomycetes bacterium]|nr:hypothetical protein [Planctomycetota bacterium]